MTYHDEAQTRPWLDLIVDIVHAAILAAVLYLIATTWPGVLTR